MNFQNSIFSHVNHSNQNIMDLTNTNYASLQHSNSQLSQEVMMLQREIADLMEKNKRLEIQSADENRNVGKIRNDLQAELMQSKNEILRLKEQLSLFTNPTYSNQTTSNYHHSETYPPNIGLQSTAFWSQHQDSLSLQNPSSSTVLNEFFATAPAVQQQQREQSIQQTSPKQLVHKSTQYAVLFPCNKCTANKKFGKTLFIKKKKTPAISPTKRSLPIRKTRPTLYNIIDPNANEEEEEVSEEDEARSSENHHDSDFEPEPLEEQATASAEPQRIVRLTKMTLSSILGSSSAILSKKSRKLASTNSESGEKIPLKCNFCEKTFQHRRSLVKHERIHTGEKLPEKPPVKCTFCEKVFKTRRSLVEHERCHTGEKPFPCKLCDKSFRKRQNLVDHERRHTGEKPYKCKFCEKTFSSHNQLHKHVKIHTGEKPFKCKHCDASFKRSDHLKQHERLHTDERPYECDQCGSRFKQMASLQCHQRSNHKN